MPGTPDNIGGIMANRDRCLTLVESSLMPVTALVPKLGYHQAAAIAEEASRTGKTVREIVLGKHLISAVELDLLLNLTNMTKQANREQAVDVSGHPD